MRSKQHAFITSMRPKLLELQKKLNDLFNYASILVYDSQCKNYVVSNSGTSVTEHEKFSGNGIVIRVYYSGSYAEYSFNVWPTGGCEAIITALQERLLPVDDKLPDCVEVETLPLTEHAPLYIDEATEMQIDPEEYGAENIIFRLLQTHRAGLASDSRILDCVVAFEYQKQAKLFLSKNRDLTQSITWSDGYIVIIASLDGKVRQYKKPFSILGGAELLDAMEPALPFVKEQALALLLAEPIQPGEYDCICAPEVSGLIAHEAFGHGVEMDMFVKKRALAENYMGRQVASPLVTMHDCAYPTQQVGSYFFDDDGIPASDTVIIDKGILRCGISDVLSAVRFGTQPTGNGRRESWERKAYARMSNTYFEPGTSKLEDMIASVGKGVLLSCSTSGMEDPKNWGIQCYITMGQEILDGKLTGRIFSPVMLTGYVPDLLKSISMISDTISLKGLGHCGKGCKELAKVSTGGPYIKARIRLG